LLSALACAPSAKTVANVSTGIIGCPAEDLVVFNYAKPTRTWAASCNDKLYVCSDGRGGARCTPQDVATVDPERLTRAKSLLLLTSKRRAYFVDKDILQGSWLEFAKLVATVRAMSDDQLESVNPKHVYGDTSESFDRELRACAGDRKLTVVVTKTGALDVWKNINEPTGPCVTQLLKKPDLKPLTGRLGQSVVLLPGVFDIRPIARPVVSAASAAPSTATLAAVSNVAPTTAAPAPPASAEVDSAVRRWLDDNAAGILACTGKDSSVVLVNIDAEGKLDVALRGAADSPETQCIRHAMSNISALPPGAAQVLHVVKPPVLTKPIEPAPTTHN
jgi:hypothetical protein